MPVSARKSFTNDSVAFGWASNSAYTGPLTTRPPSTFALPRFLAMSEACGSLDHREERTFVSIAVLIVAQPPRHATSAPTHSPHGYWRRQGVPRYASRRDSREHEQGG